MLSKIAKHAGVVAMHCIGITVGLVVGICLAQASFASEAAELLGAFLGATIAVLGAFWVSAHRGQIERESLHRILIDGVQKLLDQAKLNSVRAESSSEAHAQARVVFNRWQHVAAFSPYRDLDDFGVISLMADVDACCRNLSYYLDAPESTISLGDGPTTFTHAIRRQSSVMRSVAESCEEIARRCESALRGLNGHQ